MKKSSFKFHYAILISMSDSKYSLSVLVESEYYYFVKVMLFDSSNRVTYPSENNRDSYTFSNIKGLYTLRVELNGLANDKIIEIHSNQTYYLTDNRDNNRKNTIELPTLKYSALMGINDFEINKSSLEIYTDSAVENSKISTFNYNKSEVSPNSSLFIFLRFSSIDNFNKTKSDSNNLFYEDYEIVDEAGILVFSFKNVEGIKVNEEQGWVAFNAKLTNGIYYLIYKGNEPRQVPIYVFKNWHTQFFMTLSEVPLFGTIRIFVSRYRNFDPGSKTNKYIDILLNKLQNRDYSINQELIEIAAQGKFESPMLGLICSYIYFKSSQTKDDSLFKMIKNNMQRTILKDNDESPDIRALNILASEHFSSSNFKKDPISGTPMLRIGFETIRKASIKNRRLISKNSINDFISESLYYDSPFNTFKPISKYKKKKYIFDEYKSFVENKSIGRNIPKFIALESVEREYRGKRVFKGARKEPRINKFEKDLDKILDTNVLNFIKSSEISKDLERSWVQVAISDLVIKNDEININEISDNLNLSGNTITRIFDGWKKEVKNINRKNF